MQDAIEAVKGQVGQTWQSIAAGVPLTGPCMPSYNPSRPEEIVGTVRTAAVADVKAAVLRADEAWPAWRALPVERRAKIFRSAADLMRTRRETLAAWEVLVCG